jgi:hypothetical protein
MNRRDTELFLAQKGLAYCADRGYAAEQVISAASMAGNGQSVVMARVGGPNEKETFHWGYYPAAASVGIGKSIKRLRKVQVNSVTVIHSAERF